MMTMMPDPARYEEMVFQEGRRRGREEATKELMEWHDRVCEEMAKHHTADRPKGEWKVISKTINTTLVSCSECGKRFHIPNYCFKSERDRWKCCPICRADMRGEDNETD